MVEVGSCGQRRQQQQQHKHQRKRRCDGVLGVWLNAVRAGTHAGGVPRHTRLVPSVLPQQLLHQRVPNLLGARHHVGRGLGQPRGLHVLRGARSHTAHTTPAHGNSSPRTARFLGPREPAPPGLWSLSACARGVAGARTVTEATSSTVSGLAGGGRTRPSTSRCLRALRTSSSQAARATTALTTTHETMMTVCMVLVDAAGGDGDGGGLGSCAKSRSQQAARSRDACRRWW